MNRIPYTVCPLCGGTFLTYRTDIINPSYSYLPPEMRQIRWVQCSVCDHIFIDSYLDEVGMSLIFENDESAMGVNLERQRLAFSTLIDKVLRFKSSGRWLDVGFGDGMLLATAREYGFDVVGVEPNKRRVMTAKEFLHIEAYADTIESFTFDGFDIVSLLDVLEHVPFPENTLKIIHSKMNDKGLLIVSTPNTESILWRLLTDAGANPYWGDAEHCHNFTKTNLYALLRRSGFEPKMYSITDRYRCCMEVISEKVGD